MTGQIDPAGPFQTADSSVLKKIYTKPVRVSTVAKVKCSKSKKKSGSGEVRYPPKTKAHYSKDCVKDCIFLGLKNQNKELDGRDIFYCLWPYVPVESSLYITGQSEGYDTYLDVVKVK